MVFHFSINSRSLDYSSFALSYVSIQSGFRVVKRQTANFNL